MRLSETISITEIIKKDYRESFFTILEKIYFIILDYKFCVDVFLLFYIQHI